MMGCNYADRMMRPASDVDERIAAAAARLAELLDLVKSDLSRLTPHQLERAKELAKVAGIQLLPPRTCK